jgi:uncharacterized membrane protein
MTTRTAIGRAVSSGRLERGTADNAINVGDIERMLSVAGGGLLALWGLRKGTLMGLGLAGVGAALVARGLTGHSYLYGALDINTTGPHSRVAAVRANEGIKVDRAIMINRRPEDLYRLWRNFDNLPHLMSHLVSVESHGNRSHWVARGPGGTNVDWEAEIINEEPNRLIAWRSLEGSQVSTAGSVHFTALGGDRGTEVRVILKYDPPGGRLGTWLAWIFGEEPGQQIQDDLRRFKLLMDTGDFASSERRPPQGG